MEEMGSESFEAIQRELMCEIGKRVWNREFVAANDGNFSVRLTERTFLCTPTMFSKGFMTPDDLVVIDCDGNVVRGKHNATSEIKMHLETYRHHPKIKAVLHAHPPHVCAFAITHQQPPRAVLPEAEIWLGEVSLVPYYPPGSEEFATSAALAFSRGEGIIFASHGCATVGATLCQAYQRMEALEQYCRVLILARILGEPRRIDASHLRQFESLRIKLNELNKETAYASIEKTHQRSV